MKTKTLFAMISSLPMLFVLLQTQPVGAISMRGNLPDLTFAKSQILRNGSVEVTIINKGKAKSAATEGGYGCASTENNNGIGFGFGGAFAINALAPGETQKVILDCGKKAKILGASIDGKNKVAESNEKNNTIKF